MAESFTNYDCTNCKAHRASLPQENEDMIRVCPECGKFTMFKNLDIEREPPDILTRLFDSWGDVG